MEVKMDREAVADDKGEREMEGLLLKKEPCLLSGDILDLKA